MAKKTKYLVVRLVSAISNATRVWVRHRDSSEVKTVLFDPAVGRDVLFLEKEHIKGIHRVDKYTAKRFNVRDLGDAKE